MRVLSGIQPTGELHIGNYLGALAQWIELQEKYDCFFPIVDLHALTIPYQPEVFQKNIWETVLGLLAVGLDPEKCTIFIQSQVKEHTELTWLLNTICPVSELERMTQYKEKVRQFKRNINAGLLDYPVLMAADILLYQTDLVPVGKDQLQHLELTRTLARKFNRRFGKIFKEPRALLPKLGAKIMSLQNPEKKMSKSLGPQSYLSLFDGPEIIRKKIRAAVTDPGREIKYNPEKKPGISNLLIIYSAFSKKSIKKLEKEFKGAGYEEFKKSLANLLIKKLEPFRKKKKELEKREVYVREILEKGRKRAQIIAQSTIQEVRKRMGLT